MVRVQARIRLEIRVKVMDRARCTAFRGMLRGCHARIPFSYLVCFIAASLQDLSDSRHISGDGAVFVTRTGKVHEDMSRQPT